MEEKNEQLRIIKVIQELQEELTELTFGSSGMTRRMEIRDEINQNLFWLKNRILNNPPFDK